MKRKIHELLRGLLIAVTAVVLFFGVIYLVDVVLDGTAADIFKKYFIQEEYYRQGDQYYNYAWIRWNEFKRFVIIVCGAGLGCFMATIYITRAVARTQTEKRVIGEAGRLAAAYFSKEGETAVPAGYEPLTVSLENIKARTVRSEQALRDEAARKNDLIAYLAHDLKTPLTSVIGYLSLLDEAPDMPPEQRAKYIGISLDKAMRLENLINEFFEITRYNLHEMVLETQKIDLGYMLEQMTDEFYPLLLEHGNTVELHTQPELYVTADPIKLARVFNNVLKNAVAYSYENTPITVEAGMCDDTVSVVISNRGRNIPPERLDSIFEKFYRLDSSRSTNTGGAGLGLAIAREIIRLHGGTITAASAKETTVFTVTLPRRVQ